MLQIHYYYYNLHYIYLGLHNVQSTFIYIISFKIKASQEYKLTLNFRSMNNDTFTMKKETMPIILQYNYSTNFVELLERQYDQPQDLESLRPMLES